MDADSHDPGLLSHLYYGLRSLYIPSSPFRVLKAQKELLTSFVRTPIQHQIFQLKSGEYINYIDIVNPSLSPSLSPITFVMTHGYAAGIGLFFANYDALSSKFARVISFDWLGMGGSSRPSSGPTYDDKNPDSSINFFIDSTMEFLTGLNLGSFILMGHSLGGYLCGRFLMKYPNSGIQGLILLSAAGLRPHPPEENQVSPSELDNSRLRWIMSFWAANYTPQSFIRMFGPLSARYVKMSVLRRFGSDRWSEEQTELIANYLYLISALPPSGEYSLNSILLPLAHYSQSTSNSPDEPSDESEEKEKDLSYGVYTRQPLEPRQLVVSPSSVDTSSPNIPVLILYGDDDWIAFPEVREYVHELTHLHGVSASLDIIPRAGHHLYMDNKEAVMESIDRWWKNEESRGQIKKEDN